MATKNDLAMAAIKMMLDEGKEPSFEAVSDVLKRKYGQDVSRAMYFQAQKNLKDLLAKTGPGTAPPPPEPPPAEPPPAEPPPAPEPPPELDRVFELIELARALIARAGGDREAAVRLVRTV